MGADLFAERRELRLTTSRRVWIGTSWKMTKTIAEAREFVRAIAGVPIPAGVQPFILPAHTSLAAVRDELPPDSPVLLGAQNAHWAPEGAGTGEVSMRMVADAGASLVEIGHSERRERFGETDETVGLKTRAALDEGLTPLVCVGEPASVRSSGHEVAYVTAQVDAALSRLVPAEVPRLLVAYEPVWAIGASGRPARREEIAPVMRAITEVVSAASGGEGCLAVLYGGSVDAANADDLLTEPDTDGLFVGRAAWTARGFLRLVSIAGRHARVQATGSSGP